MISITPDHPFYEMGISTGKEGSVRLIILHRLVMAEALGRVLRRDEIVHHIDGDKCNNALYNLELCSNSVHLKKHHHKSKELQEEIRFLHLMIWCMAKRN